MGEAYVFDAVRTPRGRGRASGSLHEVSPLRLAAGVLKNIRDRNDLDTSEVDDVILGVADPVNEQGADIARTAVLVAGYDQGTPGVQINRFCASGLEACNMAAAQVMSGQSDIVIGGGVESMSRVADVFIGRRLVSDPHFTLPHYFVPQGISADLIATVDGYSAATTSMPYAAESQRRAAAAWSEGRFAQVRDSGA